MTESRKADRKKIGGLKGGLKNDLKISETTPSEVLIFNYIFGEQPLSPRQPSENI